MSGQNDQLVISVKEARKLLGLKSKNLTNEELKLLIQDTQTVVRICVREYIGSKNSENNATIPSTKATTL
ncbi:MAG TPA: hypothetical protein VN778_01925 [Verrucomicrobiae bacterium]|nr:hypothetical protein [Verrucomicrobiae bacterium]